MSKNQSFVQETMAWRRYLAIVFFILGLWGYEASSSHGAFIQWGLLILSFAFIGIILYPTAAFGQMLSLMHGAKIELRKVVWPSRDETVKVTGLVCVVVVIVASLLWGVDRILMTVVSHFAG